MRIIGLDLGSKSLGVSLSDITETIANTYKTIFFEESNYDSLIKELAEIIKENKVEKIVLGFPKNMNNSVGERAEIALEFKKKLEDNLNMEVIMQDERLTTIQAENYMLEADVSRKKRKKKIDSLAANIILQSYLDKERKNKNERRKNDI